MKAFESEAEKHHLIAGVLCLNFANTLYGHGKTPIHEYLAGYRDLVIWSRKVGILSDRESEFLMRRATSQPNEALSVFHRAIAFREAIHRVFIALAHGASPKPADLAALNTLRSEALAHSQITQTSSGFAVDWSDKTALERMLWPIALSAADLLTSTGVSRVRQCGGCDWLFLDNSRNHFRRWCSMSACGNRAKARRYLERKRRLALRGR
jgi:predicted RNA-binding Zn ribbon-like protein